MFEISTPVAKLSELIPESLVVKGLSLRIDKKWTMATLRLVSIDPDILILVESFCFEIGAG